MNNNRPTNNQEEYISELEQSLKEEKAANIRLSTELRELHQQLDESRQEIRDIKKTIGWKIGAPFRKLASLMEKTVVTHKIRKAVHILFHGGWREFKGTFRQFLNVMKQSKEGVTEKGVYAPEDTQSICYDAEYQENEVFSDQTTDVKPLAFYLPQYHPFPENDEWWGKGFTEWVNVRSGESRFEGHYQPREPHPDFGYYSLLDPEVMRKQAVLAKQHGIYGFVFYYYWFSGKRLMEKPVDMLLKHPEIDLPFCLCWANENWTRTWDGKKDNVLIGQEYSEEDDRRFIRDMLPYIRDSRYIRINGKPLIIVYNPGEIPDCHKSFAAWRKSAQELSIGDILIWTCETANNTAESLKILDCVDGIVEFPPHNMWLESIAVRGVDLKGKSAFLYHYGKLVEYLTDRMKEDHSDSPRIHHSVMMGWDNAGRRKDGWFTYCGFSLKALYKWMLAVRKKTVREFPPEKRYCFINAWNEWGEGTYLEPDLKYGYACINTISKALYDLPLQKCVKVFHSDASIPEPAVTPTIAVQVHMFYPETLEETIENLNQIPFPFDCYISSDTEEKRKTIEEAMRASCKAAHVQVEVFENRGRDVGPFLVQMQPVYQKYDYVCHIHSKKTKTEDHGNEWRKYIFRHLFGSEENIRQIFHEFEKDHRIGLIMPETYPVLEYQAEWGGNREGVADLLHSMGLSPDLPNDPVFPVGNMFWARSEALKPVFDLKLTQRDFPEEAGQVNATIAHQIERCWIYMLRENGYTYLKTFNNSRTGRKCKEAKRLCLYAHYDTANRISREDQETIRTLSSFMSDVFVMSNSDLSSEETQKVTALGKNITIRTRKNIGMDFGAWRDALQQLGKEKIQEYDEVILCNNSFFSPVFPLEEMFAEMESKRLDFWGNTIFPRLEDGAYIHKDYIPEHLQSYWMVFGRRVTRNEAFRKFWENMPDYTDYIDVVGNCESQLTELLGKEGFTYEPYIRETYYISRFLNNFAIPYEKPSSLLFLGSPFIKKKCYQYMSEEERIKLENIRRSLEYDKQ